jgi:superfamily II DNA or RNA helicase
VQPIQSWKGKLSFPEVPARRLRVGNNLILQSVFLGGQIDAHVESSPYKGHWTLVTGFPQPFDQLLIRMKGARKVETQVPTVTLSEGLNSDALLDVITVEWDSLGKLASFASTPEDVVENWKDKFRFTLEDETTGKDGLRAPQFGALHAISAHFSVGKQFDPATVVLPTGTGKTETMLANLIYSQLTRVLVIVPSCALRIQIGKKFVSLGVLPMIGVIPTTIARPRVAFMTTGIRSLEEAQTIIAESNVIVALPDSLKESSEEALAYIADKCTDLIVDEAHHITAATWSSIRDRFATKRILQFTATPFRRDRKRVDGKMIFNYKLGDAQEAGYYRPINLRTVEEYGDQYSRDLAIAKEAVKVLRHDRTTLGLDHLLMARTDSRERAEDIFAIYEKLAPKMKPVVVYSGTGRAALNKTALDMILDRGPDGARIVVCVDMLGEGFDLSNLKIAALHDTHKSLAVTLQFIGRITRKGVVGEVGEASVVTNIANPEAEAKLAELYAEGAEWDRIIKRLSEDRIDQELRLQDVVLGLKESGDLGTQLSLWNLRPALSAQFFRTTCKTWSPMNFVTVLPTGAERWYAFNAQENTLVAVVRRYDGVSWGDFENVFDTIYDLMIIKWDQQSGSLCIFASDYDAIRSEKMAQAVTDEATALVSGAPIFNILNNVELPLVKSLGSSRIGAISFTSYFGPNVTEGLASIEKAESELNNLACLGYENGDRVVWGATQRRGKVWQQKSGSISDWMSWTGVTWAKVNSASTDQSNVIRDFLRPQKLTTPYSSTPIAVQWGEQAQQRFNDHQFVQFGDVEVPLYAVNLDVGEWTEGGPIPIFVASDDTVSHYELLIGETHPGGYAHRHVAGPILQFRKGREEPVAIEEYLQKDPFIVRYADGTFSYNCYHIPTKLNAGVYEKDKLESWSWDGIPLNKESMHKDRDEVTIQYRTYDQLKGEFDLIFNDDGSGEAADLVCLKDVDDTTIRLTLVHCKGAHKGKVSQDIRNFYTVCGQAQKSITAKHAGIPTLYHALKRRNEQWMRSGHQRFLKGDMKLLTYFKDKARKSTLQFEVILVQPGASIGSITDDALRLIATTELYLFKTTQAKVRFIISE